MIVTTSGCAGLCNREPMATVEFKGQPLVKYVDLTPEKMRKIFIKHLLGGQLVPNMPSPSEAKRDSEGPLKHSQAHASVGANAWDI